MKELIKKLKLTEEQIKLKNKASIITLVVEFFKVLFLLLFLGKINTILVRIIFVHSILSTILAIFILYNDDYRKFHKYCLLDLSSLVFLLSNIVGGILIEMIIINIDKKIIKMIPQEKPLKKLPLVLYHSKLTYIYLFLSIIISYEYLYINIYLSYILIYITLIAFFINDIKISLKEFKKSFKKILNNILNNYIAMILISSVLFIIVGYIVGETSTNEQILNQNLIETTILAILYAPLAEELLFRGCLRKIIKNDLAFILISGISFGAWHVIGFNQSILQYLYIIPYSSIGIILARTYAKSNNLTVNVGIHLLNNFLASIGSFI